MKKLLMGLAVVVFVAGLILVAGASSACEVCYDGLNGPECLPTWAGADSCEIITRQVWQSDPYGGHIEIISFCMEDAFICVHNPNGDPPAV